MALLFLDGFDHLSNSTVDYGTLASAYTKWSYAGSSIGLSTTYARTGQYGIGTAGNPVTSLPLPIVGGFVVGVAVRLPAPGIWGEFGYDILQIIEISPTSTVHLAVCADVPTQRAVVKRGGTIIATGTHPLMQDNWYYMEFKGVIDDVAGSYELRFDGVTELVASGIDTRNGGTVGRCDRIALNGNGVNFDDVYVCDQSGPTHNNFLGICRVETLMAQTDVQAVGTYQDWIPITNAPPLITDHGVIVARPTEQAYKSLESATVGARDSYNYPSRTDPVLRSHQIAALQTNMYLRRTDTDERTACPFVRMGGVNYDGAAVVPPTAFGVVSARWTTNPATGLPWTATDLDVVEAGIKIVA